MKQALTLLFVVAAGFIWGELVLGYQTVYQIGYGALMLMGLMISGTFLWLWAERATPLALGMSFSWAGAAGVMGWWWTFNVLGEPSVMIDSELLFLLLSLYIVGAILHFAVIARSMALPNYAQALPVVVAALVATLIQAVF
ncbi:MAG: hypothetical protein HRU32_07565 [Rhodobacteraceae bacterium]|nr:hypothetical protein [Paracoccaceae bacterium]